MPFAPLQRPSIALGLLAAVLQREQISVNIRYANLEFAAHIPWAQSEIFTETPPQDCLGDWIFAQAAFPDHQRDPEVFLRHVCPKYKFDAHPDGLRGMLLEVRNEANHFIADLASEIAAAKPRIVGCTSSFQQHVAALALLRRLREITPEITTIIGGANCETSMGLTTHRRFRWVDYVVSGEADGLIGQLCRLIFEHAGNAPAEKLPSGVFGRVHRVRGYPVDQCDVPRALTSNLERLPSPNYDSYFETLARMPFRKEIKPALPMESSRGCWWGEKHQCTFCGLNGGGIRFRSRPAREVLDELDALSQRYCQNDFEMVDNVLDHKYFRSLLPGLSSRKGTYRFFYEVKSNLTRDQVKLLRKAGVVRMQAGIESLHSGVLRLINKGVCAAANVRLLKWCRESEIDLSWNMLYRVPQEKDEWYTEMAEWLPWICHLQPPLAFNPVRIDRYSQYHAKPGMYDLKLAPAKMYEEIYPVSSEDMANLAYFFTDAIEADNSEAGRMQKSHLTYGRRTVERWITEWRKLFVERPPHLGMRGNKDEIEILDTRPCAVKSSFVLRGIDREVLLLCDDALPSRLLQQELRNRFGAARHLQEIAASIVKLKKLKILLELDSGLISLPLCKRQASAAAEGSNAYQQAVAAPV